MDSQDPPSRLRVVEVWGEELQALFGKQKQNLLRIHGMARTKNNAVWRVQYTDFTAPTVRDVINKNPSKPVAQPAAQQWCRSRPK